MATVDRCLLTVDKKKEQYEKEFMRFSMCGGIVDVIDLVS